jgi:hypothetical protein
MNRSNDNESLEEFFRERADYFTPLEVVQNADGGFDIVLRLDGTYVRERDAIDVATYWTAHLRRLLSARFPLQHLRPEWHRLGRLSHTTVHDHVGPLTRSTDRGGDR